MPWKLRSKPEQRYELVKHMRLGKVSVAELSQRFGVSRPTAYKWLGRYQQSKLRGLDDRSRKPLICAVQTAPVWRGRVRRYRKGRPTWGGRKLHHLLVKGFGAAEAPSVATISRWLKEWGLSRGARRRRRGPEIRRPVVRKTYHCHDTWTVDFKGWYRTGDGRRVDPLTVRELHSRYGLCVKLLPNQSVEPARRTFRRVFGRHGVPKRIRCDNGTPFGGGGPSGLTRLSAWWVKLGIEVEFITPGRPCENGAHEQFHRVYKAEVARHPAWTLAQQQRRTNRWLTDYNERRPHEALRMKTPSQVYRPNERAMPSKLRSWTYPQAWPRCWVKGSGEICWKGTRRFIGEAFVRDYVGLKFLGDGIWRVFYGRLVIGDLHENEHGGIRVARYVPGR